MVELVRAGRSSAEVSHEFNVTAQSITNWVGQAAIRWYNEKRIKISLGSLSPIEYRASLGLAA
jgi:transposase